MAPPLAHFEIHCTAIDPGKQKLGTLIPRWMPSREAQAALHTAVDTFTASLEAIGFRVARTQYGVTAAQDR